MKSESSSLVLWDDGKGEFGPLCDLAPAFTLRTGAITTRERLERAFGAAVATIVPAPLAAVTAETTGLAASVPQGSSFLVVNARLLDPRSVPELGPGEALVSGDDVVAARLPRDAAIRLMNDAALPSGTRTHATAAVLARHPWHVLDRLGERIAADIDWLVRSTDAASYSQVPDPHAMRLGPHPVLVHQSATVAPQVVFDASAGPILVGAKCVVRPFTVLCGPCAIGEGSTVTDRSLIKPSVTCGPQCRLGGEVSGTSIAGRSNKSHDGHLGDSLLGEWVNLGAGTDNSNLLNTYGDVSVRLEPNGPRIRTGRMFFGAVIGDHAKCAIGTRIMTGTVIGTGAMIASSSSPPSTVQRFAWITDDGERRYALAKFIDVAKTVMARRGVTPGPAYLARLATLHGSSGTDA